MKEIPLTRDKVAIIDDEDYERINQHKWYAYKSKRTFYAQRRDGKKILWMHRIIINPSPDEQIDHINGDGLDNRKSNLRIATQHQNTMNCRKRAIHRGKPPSSKYKGVSKCKTTGHWIVQLGFNGSYIWGGTYLTEIEAAKAYDIKAKELFGIYAKTNFEVK